MIVFTSRGVINSRYMSSPWPWPKGHPFMRCNYRPSLQNHPPPRYAAQFNGPGHSRIQEATLLGRLWGLQPGVGESIMSNKWSSRAVRDRNTRNVDHIPVPGGRWDFLLGGNFMVALRAGRALPIQWAIYLFGTLRIGNLFRLLFGLLQITLGRKISF